MADQAPAATDICTRPLRGKELSAMMKQKGKGKKAEIRKGEAKKQNRSAASSASSAPSTTKKQRYDHAGSSAPSMLLTRAAAAKKVGSINSGDGDDAAAAKKKVGSINSGDGDDEVEIPPSSELNTEANASAKAAVAARAEADRKFNTIFKVEATGNRAIAEAKVESESASKAAADAKSAADRAIRDTTKAISANRSLTTEERTSMMQELMDGRTLVTASTPTYIAEAKAAAIAAAAAKDMADTKMKALNKAERVAKRTLAEAVDKSRAASLAAERPETAERAESVDESRAVASAAESFSGRATYVCDWAQAIQCTYPCLKPMPCQREGCDKLVHHLCQAAWEQSEGKEDNIAHLCCVHHPEYKYVGGPLKVGVAVANAEDVFSKVKVVNNIQNEGDRLKDPPELAGLKDPRPIIEYEMVAVDYFTGDLPPETIANEGGDFLMEARGGLVDNVQNVGDGLKDPPEGMDYASSSPQVDIIGDQQVDIIGDQWNLKKKK